MENRLHFILRKIKKDGANFSQPNMNNKYYKITASISKLTLSTRNMSREHFLKFYEIYFRMRNRLSLGQCGQRVALLHKAPVNLEFEMHSSKFSF